MKTKIFIALTVIFLNVCNAFSQGYLPASSSDYVAAINGPNYLWTSQQIGSGQFYLGRSGQSTLGSVAWGPASWNICLFYSAGALNCVASNNATGSLTPILIPMNGTGSVDSIFVGVRAKGSLPVSVSDLYLNGTLVPEANTSVSSSGLFANSSYFGLSVNSGNFSSMNFNLVLGDLNSNNSVTIIAVSPVPEPSAIVLSGLGGIVFLFLRRKK